MAFLLLLFSFSAFAGVEQLSEKEFKQLAVELAPRVNLFRDVWKQDPKAEIYGGTSRDYMLWLKGQFREAESPAAAQKIAKGLKTRSVIDVREFLIKASDVDIISEKRVSIDTGLYDVKNVDSQRPEIFDPRSERGIDERRQGHLPAEKIRLGRGGVVENPGLGDGLQEIYTGRLTAQFTPPADFAKTAYAKQKLNHPVLLALRYLRLQAMNYFQENGAEPPRDVKTILRGLDPASAKQVKEAIRAAVSGGAIAEYLEKPRFVNWVNGSIQKSFRSYSNPTAAHMLLKEFGVDALAARYSEKIEPINQFVFARAHDPARIEKEIRKAGLKPAELYSDPKDFFTDGHLYHGTKTEEAFRGIILQGVLPSTGGNAGAGLYGVDEKNIKVAEKWTGQRDLLVKFPVKANAKIIDLRKEPGASLAEKWGRDLDGLAEAYGADMLLYPYQKSYAFVVKNSEAIGKPLGVHREVMSLKAFSERLKESTDTALAKQLKGGLAADEEMLVGEELASRLGRENRSAEILKGFRNESLPASYRRSLATLIAEKGVAVPEAEEFLRALGEANMPTTEKMAAIERAGWPEDKIIAALRNVPGDQAQFANYIDLFAGSKYDHTGKLVRNWLAIASGREMLTLARHVPASLQLESRDWQERLRATVFRLLGDGEDGLKRLFDLAGTGVWDKLPAFHDELFKQLLDQDKKAAERFALSYLNNRNYPDAWKNRMPLFRELLDKGRFDSTITDLLKSALYNADELAKHPDMLIEIAARIVPSELRYHFDSGSKWMKIPLVKKIVGNVESDSYGSIETRWRAYQKEKFMKTVGKASAKDPLALMRQMRNLLVSNNEAHELLKKVPVSESQWLDILEKEGPHRDKQIFADYFLAHHPSARAKDWLVKYSREGNSDDKRNAAHLAEELLKRSRAWQEAFPVTAVDFLLEWGGSDGEYLFNNLIDNEFFLRHPEQMMRVIETQDLQAYLRIMYVLNNSPEKLALSPIAFQKLAEGIPTFPDEYKQRLLTGLKRVLERPEYAERKDLKDLLPVAEGKVAAISCAGKFAELK